MQLTTFQTRTVSSITLKFRGYDEETPDVIQKALSTEDIHTLFSKGKEQEHFKTAGPQKLEEAKADVKTKKSRIVEKLMKNRYSKALILGGISLLGLSGIGIRYASSEVPPFATATISDSNIYQMKNNREAAGFFSMVAVLASIGLLIGGFSGLQNDSYYSRDKILNFREVWEGVQELRKSLKNRNKWKILSSRIQPESDPLKARGTQLLKQQSQRLSQQIATNMRKAYQEHEAVKMSFDQIFGHQIELPNAQALEELFQFYAMETASHDRRYAFSSNSSFSESDIAKRQLALLMLCAESGEIFNVLEKKNENNAEFRPRQNIQEYMATQMPLLEVQLEKFITNYQTFQKQFNESEKYIHASRQALTAAAIRNNPSLDRIQELTVMVNKLEAHKQKIQQTLTNEQQLPNLDFVQLEAFNHEFQELMVHLKVFLAVNETPLLEREIDALGTLRQEIAPASDALLKQRTS